MKDTKKYDKSRQLHKEGYLQENRVELKGNVEVHSISSMSKERGDNANGYGNDLLEKIISRDNLNNAYRRVKANKGSHGIDGMTVDELLQYLKENGQNLRKSLLKGRYEPKPVRRVEIPKPDGGIRLLGIPTVVDRVIQQAVEKCRDYINAGYKWTVDLDLAKYFDTINHDKLIRTISEDIKDGRVISLIRKYLKSGVMVNGVVMYTEAGAPQG